MAMTSELVCPSAYRLGRDHGLEDQFHGSTIQGEELMAYCLYLVRERVLRLHQVQQFIKGYSVISPRRVAHGTAD